MYRLRFALFIFLSFTLSAAELTEKEKGDLASGKVVLKTIKIKGEVWPRLEGYLELPGTPLDCVAVYYALKDQSKYIPNMKLSEPVLQESPTVVHTKYVLDMPWPFSDTEYVNGSSIEQTGEDYLVKWWKITNPTAEVVKGSALFTQSKRKNFCNLTYKSFIRPDSIFAGIVRKIMVKDVIASLEAIRDYHHKSIKNPELMKQYKQLILKPLKGEFAYDPAPHKK